jgi:alpha-L-arabinofuranosidase
VQFSHCKHLDNEGAKKRALVQIRYDEWEFWYRKEKNKTVSKIYILFTSQKTTL